MIDLMRVKSKFDGKEILINVHHITAIYEEKNGDVVIQLIDGGIFEVEGTLENIRLNVLHTMRVGVR
jgi:uncharacterized protein YlzI (FlbEa/FlbD family)